VSEEAQVELKVAECKPLPGAGGGGAGGFVGGAGAGEEVHGVAA